MPDRVRLHDINMNLLVSLDALLQETQVSRAAKRLGVSQSALSHSLRQLRELFDDPLLVRGAGGLVRTPRADRLAAALRRGLSELERGLVDTEHDPATSSRTFSISAPEHFALMVLPDLLARLSTEAPQVGLSVRPLDGSLFTQQLAEGEIDLVLSVLVPTAPGLRVRKLLRQDFLCVVRRDHPTIQTDLTLDQYVNTPHVVHSPTGDGPSFVDTLLQEHGLGRRVALRVPTMLAAPPMVAQSDCILTAPRTLAETFARAFELRSFSPPIALGEFDLFMIWHERFEKDQAHRWLRTAFLASVEGALARDPDGTRGA